MLNEIQKQYGKDGRVDTGAWLDAFFRLLPPIQVTRSKKQLAKLVRDKFGVVRSYAEFILHLISTAPINECMMVVEERFYHFMSHDFDSNICLYIGDIGHSLNKTQGKFAQFVIATWQKLYKEALA